MALPISPEQIIAVAKFAYDLWTSCKAAKGQFEQVGKEVYAMRTVIELVHLECKNPKSIINLADNKEKTIRRQLGIHIRNCKQALSEVGALLERYSKMNMIDKAAWALWGKSEVADLESNLSSFATQLDNFVGGLALKGIGIVNENVARLRSGIGRIEEALEKNQGNNNAAVREVMKEVRKSGVSTDEAKQYETIFHDYAAETSRSATFPPANRAQTPDPPRGRDQGSNLLDVHKPVHRSRSSASKNSNASVGPPNREKPKYTLECWLIQIKTTDALFLTFHLSEKEKQVRGQYKLEEMAKQFRSLSQTSKLAGNHDLVKWVLDDKKKHEKDSRYTWYSYAGKIERKNSFYLGLGVEEQAMVIIKRQLTPAAQKRADEKERLAAAKKVAEKQAAAKKIKNQIEKEKPADKKWTAKKTKDQTEGERKDKKNKKPDAEAKDVKPK